MASMALTFSASTQLMLRTASSTTRAVAFGQGTILSTESAYNGISKVSLVVRAQKYDGETKRDISQTPLPKQFDPLGMKSFFETSRHELEPVKIEDKGNAIEIWLKMQGVGVMDIDVYVKDNKLFIQERNDISPFRKMMIQPFESIQLPPDSRKEDIVAKLGNGILYIYVPRISKHELPYDIPVKNVSR